MGSGVSVPPELPFHSSSFYLGNILESLFAVNEEQLRKFECGVWSDEVPHQLEQTIQQPERYRQAIGIINTASRSTVRFRSYWSLLLIAFGVTLFIFGIAIGIPLFLNVSVWVYFSPGIIVVVFIYLYISLMVFSLVVHCENWRIVRKLQKAISQANTLLFEENVLMGCLSNSKLFLVYVCVDDCRQKLFTMSQDHELFHKAILEYSGGYTSFIALHFFPFFGFNNRRMRTMCFCQYVYRRLHIKNCCLCCRKQNLYHTLMSSGESHV